MRKMTISEQQAKWVWLDPSSGCWLWRGFVDKCGYGKSMNSLYPGETLAHRLSWMHHRGLIPSGCEIEHTCKTRNCVNPEHLEAITHQENVARAVAEGAYKINHRNARKELCMRGHKLTQLSANRRICKICVSENDRRRYVLATVGIEITEV